MTDIITLMDFILTGVFTIVLKEYFDLFMKNRFSNRILQHFVWIMYWIIDYMVSLQISFQIPYSLFFTISNLFIICRILYTNSIKDILTSLLLIECIGCISEIIVNILLSNTSGNIFIGGVCSKILILIFARVIKLLKKQSNYGYISLSFWIANISISVGSLYIMYVIYVESMMDQRETNNFSIMLAVILILLINIISFKEFDKIAMNSEIHHTNILYKNQINYLIAGETRRKEFLAEMEKNIHDFKNHLLCIKEYASKQDYDCIIGYIEHLQGDAFDNVSVKAFSGNDLIDYLISEKVSLAKKNAIDLKPCISIPQDFKCSDFDICIILTNALDNAIEATKNYDNCNERIITLNMRFIKNSLYICVKNPFSGHIKVLNNGRFMSTKRDPANHGIGISSIKKAAENYNGLVRTSIDDNIFRIEIILYF